MTSAKSLLILLAVGILSGCSSPIKVGVDWDSDADFSRLLSWDFAAQPQKKTGDIVIDDDTLFTKRVQLAIERQMAAKGLRRDSSGSHDFEVAFFIVVQDKISVSSVNNHYGYGYGPGWGYGRGGYGTSSTRVDQYQQGTLIIDITQGEDPQLLWRGSGSARLRKKSTPQKQEARINEVVTLILAKFPPATGG